MVGWKKAVSVELFFLDLSDIDLLYYHFNGKSSLWKAGEWRSESEYIRQNMAADAILHEATL